MQIFTFNFFSVKLSHLIFIIFDFTISISNFQFQIFYFLFSISHFKFLIFIFNFNYKFSSYHFSRRLKRKIPRTNPKCFKHKNARQEYRYARSRTRVVGPKMSSSTGVDDFAPTSVVCESGGSFKSSDAQIDDKSMRTSLNFLVSVSINSIYFVRINGKK